MSVAGVEPHRAERRAVGYVLGAAVLFAACNVAWRFGEGATTAVVALRAALGAVIGWAITRRRVVVRRWEGLRTRAGARAVLTAAASLVAAGTMFRSLDGLLAAMAVACTPAVALLVRDRVGPLATLAAVGSSAAALVGLTVAATADGTEVTWLAVGAAVVFVAVEVWSIRAGQVAVEAGIDPVALVTASMAVAALVVTPLAVGQSAGDTSGTVLSAILAAVVVALLGTVGRVIRTTATPAVGVPTVAASAQISALGTAVGGVVLLGDRLSVVGVVCTALAAVLGALAVVAGTRWRLERRAELAVPLPAAVIGEPGR